MPAKELAIASAEHIRRRRRRSKCIAKAIDPPALNINAGKQWCGNALLALAQQPPRLFRILDVPRMENASGRLPQSEEGTGPRRKLRPVETNDQQLADFYDTASLALDRHL